MQHYIAADGANIAYTDRGSGRPLLLLHGLMAHHGFFKYQEPLAAEFRLIEVDLRGQGASRRDSGRPTIEQMAQDVAGLIEELDLRQAIGIGWSLGATVLWRLLAGPVAHRFDGAVVVDMTPRVLNDGDWELGLSAEACEARSAAIRGDFENFALGAGQAIFAQPVSERSRADAEWAGREFARNDPSTVCALWHSLAAEDLRPLLGSIQHPTLIIHGAQSQLYGSDTAEYLKAALPKAETLQFNRSGHAPHMEQPELFNTAIREFAASLPRVREVQNTA